MADNWIIRLGDKKHKPLPASQVEVLIRQGKIPATAEASKDGHEWISIKELVEIVKSKEDRGPSASDHAKKLITCQCGKRYSVDARMARRKLKCPSCDAVIQVTTSNSVKERISVPKEGTTDGGHSDIATRRCLEVKDPLEPVPEELRSEFVRKLPSHAIGGAIALPIVTGSVDFGYAMLGAVLGSVVAATPWATGGCLAGFVLVGIPAYFLGYSDSVLGKPGALGGTLLAIPLLVLDILTWKAAFRGPYEPRTPSPGELEELIDQLSDDRARTRSRAAKALCEFGPASQAALPALSRLLKDTDSNVRLSAASAIGRIGPASGTMLHELVTMFSDDEDTRVRREAALAAARIGPAATRFLPEFKLQRRNESDPIVEDALQAGIRVLECYPEAHS